MNDGDVGPNEMNEPHDFDESAIEALMAGEGRDASAHVADFIGDMRVAYTSTPPTAGAELAALMATAPPVAAASLAARRFERMRASMLARIGAATAVVIAATGGLAVAQALPAPVQNLISHIGIGPSGQDGPESAPTRGSSTTTSTAASAESTVSTPATTGTKDNHGTIVSGVAHDKTNTGCEHGAAVSQVASDGRSHNDAQNASKNTSHGGSCTSTTTTVVNGTPSSTSTTTSAADNNHGAHGDTTPTSKPEVNGGDQGASHDSPSNHGKGGS